MGQPEEPQTLSGRAEASAPSIQSVDVVMPTWNSNGWWFPGVLDSLVKNCRLCHLVVVDRHSKDGTIEALRLHVPQARLKIIDSDCDLAQARQLGISSVDTGVFAFVDSDIQLSDGWQAKMDRMIREDRVGAVQGTEADVYDARALTPEVRDLIPTSSLTMRGILRYGLFNLVRGMTTQTLVKTELVRDWLPDTAVSSFEDFSLTQHVLSKGYRWIRADGVVSRHHKYPEAGESRFEFIHDWYAWGGAGARASGKIPLRLVMVNSVARIAGASLRFLRREVSFEQMSFIVLMQLSIIQGFVQSERFVVSHR